MFTLGIDFGTLSGRALLVDIETGAEVAAAVVYYPHGVMDRQLPINGHLLPPDWALQDPQDYLKALSATCLEVMGKSKVSPDAIAGIGIAFTSSTPLPTTGDGTPLCFLEKWRDDPHAWAKLWKHHASQAQADTLTQAARTRGEHWLNCYGGKVSSEWFFSKALQMAQESPHVYTAAERLIEAGDWIVWQLTNVETRSSCLAGYKAFYQNGKFPSNSYFASVDPAFADVLNKGMSGCYSPPGIRAGGLTEQAAAQLGLKAGTPVAVANGDGFATVPAVKVTGPGQMVIVLGTSSCHILLSEDFRPINGICGVVRDGIIPGYYSYEAGQSAVGDIFAWYTEHGVGPECIEAARQAGQLLYQYLEAEASKVLPGESGLLALDWWNGNRSMLVDASRRGLLLGITLATRETEIYRALIEATAYGTRLIIDAFEAYGMPVHGLILSGGLPERNRLLVEIYANVTGRQIRLSGSKQPAALGAAIYAAVAAGAYPDVAAAASVMGKLKEETIQPDPDHHSIYDILYAEYKRLYDYFGNDDAHGGNDVMKVLKSLRLVQRQKRQ